MIEEDEKFISSILAFILTNKDSVSCIKLSWKDYTNLITGKLNGFVDFRETKVFGMDISMDRALPQYHISVEDDGDLIKNIPIEGIKEYDRYKKLISFT